MNVLHSPTLRAAIRRPRFPSVPDTLLAVVLGMVIGATLATFI